MLEVVILPSVSLDCNSAVYSPPKVFNIKHF